MPLYRIANLLIDSATALPGLQVTSPAAGAWRFRIGRGAALPKRSVWYHHEYASDGQLWRSLARDGDREIVRFCRQATFVVSFPDRQITCVRGASASLEMVRQLLVGHVLPLVFAGKGALALHASAVRVPDGVVVFVGSTGRGKSTIASALGMRGYPLMADDCAVVDVDDRRCRVRPLDVGIRLWPDAMTTLGVRGVGRRNPSEDRKARRTARALGIPTHTRPALLHRIYLLEPAAMKSPVRIDAVPRSDAVVALLAASFHLGMDRPDQMRRAFDRLTTLASRVPVRRLHRPRGLRHLPSLIDAVLADAAM
jgi:hypothetical protein